MVHIVSVAVPAAQAERRVLLRELVMRDPANLRETPASGLTTDDDMTRYYRVNPHHYQTGLMRIGCSREQALLYSTYFNTLRQEMYEICEQFVRPRPEGIDILDFGCGTGNDLISMAIQYPRAGIVGLELSEESCQICRASIQKAGLARQTRVVSGHLADIDQTFDLIYSFCVLEHVADPEKEIRGIVAHLKPDGVAVLVYPGTYYWWFWMLPTFLAILLKGGRPHPHSVTHRVLSRALLGGARVLDEGYYGYRPPQPMFRLIPVRVMRRLIHHFHRMESIMRSVLPSTLYLRYYVVQKPHTPLANANKEGPISGSERRGRTNEEVRWYHYSFLVPLLMILPGFYWVYDFVRSARDYWKRAK